jgi:hypothetical protein
MSKYCASFLLLYACAYFRSNCNGGDRTRFGTLFTFFHYKIWKKHFYSVSSNIFCDKPSIALNGDSFEICEVSSRILNNFDRRLYFLKSIKVLQKSNSNAISKFLAYNFPLFFCKKQLNLFFKCLSAIIKLRSNWLLLINLITVFAYKSLTTFRIRNFFKPQVPSLLLYNLRYVSWNNLISYNWKLL